MISYYHTKKEGQDSITDSAAKVVSFLSIFYYGILYHDEYLNKITKGRPENRDKYAGYPSATEQSDRLLTT